MELKAIYSVNKQLKFRDICCLLERSRSSNEKENPREEIFVGERIVTVVKIAIGNVSGL